MVNVLAVALKGGVYFLFAEMKSVGPIDIAIFHEGNIWIIAVVFFFEEAIVEAGVDHKKDVVEVEGMSDGMFVEEDLFFVLA